MNNIPRRFGYPVNEYQVEVDCPYCSKMHLHGIGGMSTTSYSHRGSHCSSLDKNKDIKDVGYDVILPKNDSARFSMVPCIIEYPYN